MYLKDGSTGGLVELVQHHLNFIRLKFPNLGPSALTRFGRFDSATDAMVRAFQERPGNVKVDGVVGPGTGRALNYFSQLVVNANPMLVWIAPQPIPTSHLKKGYDQRHDYLFYLGLPFENPASAQQYELSPMAELTSDRNQNTPWMTVAYGEFGTAEVRGGENARILRYSTALETPHREDETPWCSSFANWVMLQVGIAGTRSGWAKNWLNWGRSLGTANPRYGAITVFNRRYPDDDGAWKNGGHVGFYVAEKGSKVLVLGGNQGDQVKISEYPKASARYRLLDYRWPAGLI